MKALLKLSLGVALAVTAANLLMRKRAAGADQSKSRSPAELVSDTNMVHDRDAGEEQRGPQPQDSRMAQNVLE